MTSIQNIQSGQIAYLYSQLGNIPPTPPPYPTSSNLADVLLNGNSAGATDIDMNGQSITATGLILPLTASQITLTTPILGGNNIDIISGSNLDFVASDNIAASADAMTFTTATGNFDILSATQTSINADSISLTTSGNNVNITSGTAVNILASDGVDITATSDPLLLTAILANMALLSGDGMTLTTSNNQLSLTCNGADISLTATDKIDLTSTTDSINLNANLDIDMNSNAVNMSSAEIGSSVSPQLTITNLNATAGNTNGVPAVSFYKNGRNVNNNDRIGDLYFNANDTISTKREWARIEVVTRNVTAGNEDGSISFFASLNGVSTEFMRINGADGDNNFLRPLDMNGSAINSTSGNLSISASGSSGTGTITLTPKPLGNLIFQNLPTSAVGLPTGAVWNNLGVLNIAP